MKEKIQIYFWFAVVVGVLLRWHINRNSSIAMPWVGTSLWNVVVEQVVHVLLWLQVNAELLFTHEKNISHALNYLLPVLVKAAVGDVVSVLLGCRVALTVENVDAVFLEVVNRKCELLTLEVSHCRVVQIIQVLFGFESQFRILENDRLTVT